MTRQPYDPRNPGSHNLTATSYDPAKLVADIIALLEDRGLTPQPDERPEAQRETATAARVLLRGLGIIPGIAAEDALDLDGGARYSSRMHGD
jgi:hypothetical protein